jgi:bacteriorhodopsin
MLYPIAYLMPVISLTAEGVVVRQLLFTIADIVSKVIYGILLMRLASIKSKNE